MLVHKFLEGGALHVKVGSYNFHSSVIRSLLIDPPMRVLLHAAIAAHCTAPTTLSCLKLVLISKALVFCEGEALLDQVLH